MIDIDKIIVLIILAIQLPVVTLIVFFTINSTIASGVDHENFLFFRRIRGHINKKNPLFFIAIGFSFNLIYLITTTFLTYKSIILQSVNDNQQHSLIFSLRILTTYCFLLQSLPQLYISNSKSNKIDNSRSNKEIIFKWKRFKQICITLFAIIIWYVWNGADYDSSIPFHLFELAGNLLASLYLFYLTSIHKNSLQNNYSRYFILAGWIIWTLLQLWGPLGLFLGNNINQVDLIGFSLSLFAKCLILYGLINISTGIADYVKEELNRGNIHLNFANRRLNSKLIELSSLQNLINSASNSADVKELSGKVVDHLTNKKVFDFDYAIFTEVNYLKQKIIYGNSKTVNDNIEQTEKWMWSEGVPFLHHDIMAKIVESGDTIHAYQENLNGEPIDIASEKSPLNYAIYTKYNHQNLNRFFIPVKNLKDRNKDASRVVAIIEVGYYVKDSNPKIDSYKTKDVIKKLGELNLYLDNCAQTYERLFNQELEAEIGLLLKECDGLSKDDHLMYLQEVLQSTSRLISAEFGVIALIPMNKTLWNINLIYEKDKTKDKDKSQIENLLNQCIEQDGDLSDEIKINESKLEYEMNKLRNIRSLQANRICFQEVTIGYLFMFSKNKSHFNEVVKSTAQKIAGNIGVTYNEKKFHRAVSSLVTPDNAITDLEANIQPLIEILKSYFETSFISIWLNIDDRDFYVQKYASNELKSSCSNFGANKIAINEIKLEADYNLIPIDSNDNNIEYSAFRKYGRNNKIKTILQKPIKTQHQNYGFINIYLNRTKENVVYEEINFLNLISVKALITIQIHNLVDAFREISDSFTQNNLNATLQTITQSAVNLLNADPVILYKSSDGENVFCSDITFSYKAEFREKQILNLIEKEKETHVNLAERIIKDGSQYFSNKNQYKDYVRKFSINHNNEFNKDFWERENIQAMAAVKLVHRSKNYVKAVGVMFINFRNEIDFNDELIKLIETFAAFASGSIYNGLVFEQNREFLLSNLRLTKSSIAEALIAGALHDAKKKFTAIHLFYIRLIEKIDNPYDFNNKKMDKIAIRGELEKLKLPFIELEKHFYDIEALYAPAENTIIDNCDIKTIMEQQLTIMEPEFRQKNIKVIKDFSDDEIYVDCDQSQIGLVFLNILKNAYQAMENRGELKIRIEKTKSAKVKIEIIDNGKGISDDIKDVMFQPNITNKIGGSGLGLSMSKYVIENNHRGVIKGITKDGKTTFTIYLPIEQSNFTIKSDE